MADQIVSLRLRFDHRTVRRSLRRLGQLTAEIAQLPLELRLRFLDLGNFLPELVRIETRSLAATPAGDIRLALCLSDRYFQLLRAVRTREFEGVLT